MTANLDKGIEPIQFQTMGSGGQVIYIPPQVIPYFKDLIRKGGNCWLNAPIEIKEFVSQFGHGLPADDHYRNHAVYKSAEQLNERHAGVDKRN